MSQYEDDRDVFNEGNTDQLTERARMCDTDYEIKVLCNGDRIELSIADKFGLYNPDHAGNEYTIEKHYIGSHFEILCDMYNLEDAKQVLAELKSLNENLNNER